MQTIAAYLRLCTGALFLRDEAYAEMRDVPNPFVKGLILIVLVAILVSLVAIVGTVLEWATTPNFRRIQEAVWEGMMRMPWVKEIPPGERERVLGMIRAQYDFGWGIARQFAPHPLRAVIEVITTPISLVVGWLVYGLLAHFFAKVLGGRARLGQTYGCTALAVSPRVLNLVSILPYTAIGALATIWSLICNYLALKNAHELSPGRAFWATVLPILTLSLLVILLSIGGGMAIGNFIGRSMR